MHAQASTAAPSQDMSMTARLAAALVVTNSARAAGLLSLARADRIGNALVATGTARPA